MVTDSLVTVATFASLEEAELAQIRLEAEGVQSFVPDTHVLSLGYGVPVMYGGVKLQVLRSTIPLATEILSQFSFEPYHAAVAVEEVSEVVAAPRHSRHPICPECGCSVLAPWRPSRKEVWLGILKLGIPLLLRRTGFICRVCGARWRQ